MPTFKSVRFSDLKIFGEFTLDEQLRTGLNTTRQTWVKTSPKKAAPTEGTGPIMSEQRVFSTSLMVSVAIPDPTPEQLTERRKVRFLGRLERFEERSDLDTFKHHVNESNAAFAFENFAERALTTAMRLRVAAQMRHIFDHQSKESNVNEAIDAAIRYASQEAMQGARYPRRSTSPMSNLAAQELASAYAEFVHGF